MRWLHFQPVEAFLGPKATSANLRAYLRLTRSVNGQPDTDDIVTEESDVSQRKAHGYHIWFKGQRFEVPEPSEGVTTRIAIKMFVNNIIRDDECVAMGFMNEAMIANLVDGLTTGNVEEFDIALRPSKELNYLNDDGGAQEIYNYRLRTRVLITPAGVEPTAQHLAQLTADSEHFDPKEEKPGDEDNNIGLIGKATAISSEMSRWPIFRALKLLLFAILALVSAALTVKALVDEVMRLQSADDWHTTNPEEGDRCVAFFDTAIDVWDNKVKPVDEANGDAGTLNASMMFFNYNLQNATVAFCTDESRSIFDDALDAETFFDAGADVLGDNCKLTEMAGWERLRDGCSPQPMCTDAYNTAPITNGILLGYTIDAGNSTARDGSGTLIPCPNHVAARHSVTYPACPKSQVYVYKYVRSKLIYLLYIFSFIFCWGRIFLECVGVFNYTMGTCKSCGPSGADAVLFEVAFRGLIGPIYYLYRMIKERTTYLPIVTEPPIIVDIILIVCEALPNIAMPVYAIYGCTNANTWMLVLLIFGIAKVGVLVLSKIVMLILRVTSSEAKVSASEILAIRQREGPASPGEEEREMQLMALGMGMGVPPPKPGTSAHHPPQSHCPAPQPLPAPMPMPMPQPQAPQYDASANNNGHYQQPQYDQQQQQYGNPHAPQPQYEHHQQQQQQQQQHGYGYSNNANDTNVGGYGGGAYGGGMAMAAPHQPPMGGGGVGSPMLPLMTSYEGSTPTSPPPPPGGYNNYAV